MTPVAANHFRLVGPPIEAAFDRAKPDGPLRMLFQPDGAAKPQVYDAEPKFLPTTTQLHDYAGAYRSEEIDPVYRIIVEENGLVLKRLKSPPSKLTPAIQDYFLGSAGSLHFVRNAGGNISGFVLNTGRIQNFQFKKVSQP
jgi:hypothetical protein